jgi:Fur family transcriptional regulator, stress-responsive regulator
MTRVTTADQSEDRPTDGATALRAAGLRVTGPRLGVLQALRTAPHSDTDTVIRLVRDELGAVSAQAVYNVLAALVEAGLVRRIEPAGSPARYEVRVGDNHHHIVCRVCGATTDVDCAVGRRPCLTPSETHGYVLDEAEVTFWGLCPDCGSREVHEKQRHTSGPASRPEKQLEAMP